MAVDHTHETIALAFRGTVSPENWLTDFYALYEDVTGIEGCAGCKAHAGFWDAVQAVSGGVFPPVRDAAQQYPGNRIVFMGHSLGDALATIAAALFRQEAKVDLVRPFTLMPHTIPLIYAVYLWRSASRELRVRQGHIRTHCW